VVRASSPLLIVCDHSDYDSDSEPNNSDRSDNPSSSGPNGKRSATLVGYISDIFNLVKV